MYKIITLVSRWYGLKMNLRVPKRVADILSAPDGMNKLNMDLDRYHYGCVPEYLTPYQCRRIINYFSEYDINYWETIETNS